MKILDFNQRPNDEFLLRCNCGDDHFLGFTLFHFDDWDDGSHEDLIEAHFISAWRAPAGLLDRIKATWRFFRKVEYCAGTIDFNRSDLDKIITWCERIKSKTAVTYRAIAGTYLPE